VEGEEDEENDHEDEEKEEEDNEFLQCPICLEGFEDFQRIKTLPCFHRLHLECAENFF